MPDHGQRAYEPWQRAYERETHHACQEGELNGDDRHCARDDRHIKAGHPCTGRGVRHGTHRSEPVRAGAPSDSSTLERTMNDEQKQQRAQDRYVAGLQSASMRDSALNARFVFKTPTKPPPTPKVSRVTSTSSGPSGCSAWRSPCGPYRRSGSWPCGTARLPVCRSGR